MARSRNLKPGFFRNEDLAECTPWARLCFAGLWTLADREGRLEDRPKRIKGDLFAFDTVEVEPLLAELDRFGFIRRYASEGKACILVVNFCKHQNPHHREGPSELPAPESPGLAGRGNQHKPEALTALDGGQAGGKPEASLGIHPPTDDLARGQSRADSLFSDSPLSDSRDTKAEALGAKAPGVVWGLPLEALRKQGMSEQNARSFIGKLLSQHSEADVLQAFADLSDNKVHLQSSWVARLKSIKPAARRGCAGWALQEGADAQQL